MTETKTQWLTRGLGGRWVLHLLPPPPPTHPHCRSLIRPHHQLHKTNTYESQQERIHKSGCSPNQIVLLLLFQEPLWCFFLSLLRVCCLNHNCFVMESELDLWAETGDSFYLIAVNLLLLFKSSFWAWHAKQIEISTTQCKKPWIPRWSHDRYFSVIKYSCP